MILCIKFMYDYRLRLIVFRLFAVVFRLLVLRTLRAVCRFTVAVVLSIMVFTFFIADLSTLPTCFLIRFFAEDTLLRTLRLAVPCGVPNVAMMLVIC